MINLLRTLPLSHLMSLTTTQYPTPNSKTTTPVAIYASINPFREVKPTDVIDAFYTKHEDNDVYAIPFLDLATDKIAMVDFIVALGATTIKPYLNTLRTIPDSSYGELNKLIRAIDFELEFVLGALGDFGFRGDELEQWEALNAEHLAEQEAVAEKVKQKQQRDADLLKRQRQGLTDQILECETNDGICTTLDAAWLFKNGKVYEARNVDNTRRAVERLHYELGYNQHGNDTGNVSRHQANQHPDTGMLLPRGYVSVAGVSNHLGHSLHGRLVDARAKLAELGVDYMNDDMFRLFQPVSIES